MRKEKQERKKIVEGQFSFQLNQKLKWTKKGKKYLQFVRTDIPHATGDGFDWSLSALKQIIKSISFPFYF